MAGVESGQRWTVWELPPGDPPRALDGGLARNDAHRLAAELNGEAKVRGMSTFYIAWPSGERPPMLRR